jgi:hypothetical protein
MKLSDIRRMGGVSRIWLIFGLVFLVLGVVHFYLIFQSIKQFPGATVEPIGLDAVFISEVSLDNVNKALEKFTRDINEYIDNYNKSSRNQNIFATLGYLAASFLSFVSMREGSRNRDSHE